MEISSEVLTALVGVASSILTLSLNKFFTRKSDKVDLQEKQMRMADKIIDGLQDRLDTYIEMAERAVKDIARLQERLRYIYPYTCIIDCAERQLLDSKEVNADVSINNKATQSREE